MLVLLVRLPMCLNDRLRRDLIDHDHVYGLHLLEDGLQQEAPLCVLLQLIFQCSTMHYVLLVLRGADRAREGGERTLRDKMHKVLDRTSSLHICGSATVGPG